MTGYVFKLEQDKGYGFIRDEQGMSRFFNAKHVLPQIDFDKMAEGQAVTFTPVSVSGGKGNGLRAVDVVLAVKAATA